MRGPLPYLPTDSLMGSQSSLWVPQLSNSKRGNWCYKPELRRSGARGQQFSVGQARSEGRRDERRDYFRDVGGPLREPAARQNPNVSLNLTILCNEIRRRERTSIFTAESTALKMAANSRNLVSGDSVQSQRKSWVWEW